MKRAYASHVSPPRPASHPPPGLSPLATRGRDKLPREIDRLVDGVGEGESPAHAPCFPYQLGKHGTVWGFGLNTARRHVFINKLVRYPSCEVNSSAR
jgi:hypothetical protein